LAGVAAQRALTNGAHEKLTLFAKTGNSFKLHGGRHPSLSENLNTAIGTEVFHVHGCIPE
jgi:hypothetical protein